ncbi:hypothetical protein RGN35_002122 [Acinetobacter baumannii]|uniref:Uncharacterized protein n=1 Tax=Acinetobacter baumannii 1499986 TaxID=1310673 RepID=A0A836LYM9_ACIBA|nr:hypothetical protein [Acinetobacter baumannii]EKV6414980.1 hypothetical protein [Acinetobacter baumannii]ELA8525405.1 hypothetical protein [Acinetobacter baumannii]EMA4665756.1 hypothetical protein [Acinetobacter baumannii]EXC37591.1 hypothetical protein J552_2843 [Acinetobacter baumannii 951631]EXG10631.1 hypothetical protein J712_2431 [Acinetobacter baumannii 722310]
MLDPSIITRGAERAQLQQQQTNEMLGNLGGALGQMVLGRRINQMRQLGTPDEQKAFANNSIFAPQLNQVLKSDQVTAQKNAIDLLKAQAEIGKTNSEATKNNAQAGGFTLDNSQKKFGAIQGVFQQAAMTGDKGQVLLGLDALQRTGWITPDDYSHQFSLLQAMTPDEVKNYARGIAFTDKNTAPLLYQSANNAADNATSVANNIRTTDASRYATDTAAATADKNRAQDAQQFSRKQQLDEWLAKNKPIGTEMGNDGYMYAIYPGGKGVRISDERGSPIQVQPKGSNSTVTSQNEEKQRISRVNAVLDEIQGILPQATASYAGRGIDLLARGVGLATPGDVATGKLGTLGGQLVALMPKMSGPQSDKDVAMYKQMAGQLDDPTIPLQVRQAALETIRSLNNKYAEMNSQRPSTVPYRNNAPANTQPQSQAKLNNILFGK